jgi:hypothetical protein
VDTLAQPAWHHCHVKSVAWTNRVIFLGIYNVSNGFTVTARTLVLLF